MPSVGTHQAQIATYDYSFATHGGAIGTINVSGVGNGGVDQLPNNCLILRAWLEPSIDFTSGGLATIALGIEGNGAALLAATAFSDARFDPDAFTAASAALPLKVNDLDDVTITLTVATAALTAGAAQIHVEYLPGT